MLNPSPIIQKILEELIEKYRSNNPNENFELFLTNKLQEVEKVCIFDCGYCHSNDAEKDLSHLKSGEKKEG